MKPEEAEKKWCPQARLILSPQGDVYFNNDWGGTYCLVSNCMAWVWDNEPRQSGVNSSNPSGCAYPGEGHCGLVKQ